MCLPLMAVSQRLAGKSIPSMTYLVLSGALNFNLVSQASTDTVSVLVWLTCALYGVPSNLN